MGVLYINKPSGITSFDICYKLRRVLNTKKIGHTGTLDPNATGVMVILYNNATKANQFLVSLKKEYIATVKIGIETDTLDIDGKIINQVDTIMPSSDKIINALNGFLGESKQLVPLTSAIKVNGRKLYEYQRKNIEVEVPYKDINVYSIELLDIKDNEFTFKACVSAGTYIRSLARDILNKLGIIGTLSTLIRTSIDDISINDCDDFDEVLKGNYNNHDLLDIMSRRYKCIEYSNISDVVNGKRIKINCDDNRVIIVNNSELYALYEKDDDCYKCIRGLR